MARKYKVGDRVRIVNKWGPKNTTINKCGKMDHWLGKIMTIRSNPYDAYYIMYEDENENGGGGWAWSSDDIAGLADEPAKIVITTDGRTTKACRYAGKERTGEAVAVCSPSDKFDFTTGARIAFDRLFGADQEHSTNKTLRDVVAEREPDSVDPEYCGGVLHCPGDYSYLHDKKRSSNCKDRNCWACWSRPYVESVPEPKFKAGDVAIITGNTIISHAFPIGSVVMVKSVVRNANINSRGCYYCNCIGCGSFGELRQVIAEDDLKLVNIKYYNGGFIQ